MKISTLLEDMGKTLERIRRAMGLTRAQLADHLDVSVETVHRWCRDRKHYPSPDDPNVKRAANYERIRDFIRANADKVDWK